MTSAERKALIEKSAGLFLEVKNAWLSVSQALPARVYNRWYHATVNYTEADTGSNWNHKVLRRGFETLGPRQLLKVFNALTIARLTGSE